MSYQSWNIVDPKLKMKQNKASDFRRRFWYNAAVWSWNNKETTLYNVNKTAFQRWTTSLQRCFYVDIKLSQRCFNLISASVTAISKPVWLVISMKLQTDYEHSRITAKELNGKKVKDWKKVSNFLQQFIIK